MNAVSTMNTWDSLTNVQYHGLVLIIKTTTKKKKTKIKVYAYINVLPTIYRNDGDGVILRWRHQWYYMV